MNEPTPIKTAIQTQSGSVVSREIINRPTGTVTLFAFDAGQGLSEHSAPYDALVLALEGSADITVGGVTYILSAGEYIILPASSPHALKALTPFTMMLTMIKN